MAAYGHGRRRTWTLLLLLLVLGAGPVAAPAAAAPARVAATEDRGLSAALLEAVRRLRFDEVLDYQTGGRIAGMPTLDLAVIELDAAGRPRAAANVLFDRLHPDGLAVRLRDLRATGVQWRLWDQERWDASASGRDEPDAPEPGTGDSRTGGADVSRTDGVTFMSPFPASILKLMVGFGVLRQVDRRRVDLDAVREDLDAMITRSDNVAAMRLIALLHELDAVAEVNRTFARLGLDTLRLSGTDPDGGHWSEVRMTALDTARLLLIVSGAPGVLWRTAQGRAVRSDVLTPRSRAHLYRLLAEQGLNHAMSTTNFCGQAYPPQGIPQRTPRRWMNAAGAVTVGDHRYGRDVSPCNAEAEVTYAHKTGWTSNAGGDAGIVHALPGKPARDYIVVLLSNLGARFGDRQRPATPAGLYPFPYTRKIPELGRIIDDLMTTRRARATLRAELL